MILLNKAKRVIMSSLSNKFIAVFLVCLMLPLLILMVVFILQLRTAMRDKELAYVDERISYINAQLNRIVMDMDSTATSLLTNTNVQIGLSSRFPIPDYAWFYELRTINSILSSMAAYSHYRYQITIVSADNSVYQCNSNNQNNMLRIDSPIVRHIADSDGTVVFNRYLEGFDDTRMLTLGRAIYSGQELTGVILVEISLRELDYFISPFTSIDTHPFLR